MAQIVGNALRTLMTSVLPYDPHSYLHEGMLLKVVRGPLQGLQKRHRSVIRVWLIQQAAKAEIDVRDVRTV